MPLADWRHHITVIAITLTRDPLTVRLTLSLTAAPCLMLASLLAAPAALAGSNDCSEATIAAKNAETYAQLTKAGDIAERMRPTSFFFYGEPEKILKLGATLTENGFVMTEPTDNGQAILVNLPDGVTFDVGSATLKPEFRATLDKVAESLIQYPNSLIDVYGHTDSTGSDAFNQTLSENRARTVMNYLIMKNVPAARIRSQGFGETMPIADNATPEGRSKNRRVEIKIVPVTQEDVAAARAAGS